MLEETNISQGENRRGIIIGKFHGNVPNKPHGNCGNPAVGTASSKL
jgi:hypothetical protein